MKEYNEFENEAVEADNDFTVEIMNPVKNETDGEYDVDADTALPETAKPDMHPSEPTPTHRYYEQFVKPEKKAGSFKKVVALVLAASLVCGSTIGLSIGFSDILRQKYFNAWNTSENDAAEKAKPFTFEDAVPTAKADDEIKQYTGILTKDIVNAVSPSVVNISCTIKGTTNYFNYSVPFNRNGAGSGIIFHEDGTKVYIVTNNHVVQGAAEITVSFENEEKILAEIIGTDSQSDLAVIAITKEALSAKGIDKANVAIFGDSSKMEVGDIAIAIGNALGDGKISTQGIISAISKEINVDGKTLQVLQTDAAINPGNSGGALANASGEVIGINTAKVNNQWEPVEGIGFAIPSNILKPIVAQLMNEGYIARPYLGIQGRNVTDEASQLYQLPIGVYIVAVVPGSSADEAGITEGDVLTVFDGVTIKSMEQLQEVIKSKKVGDVVKIRVLKNGKIAKDVTAALKDLGREETGAQE